MTITIWQMTLIYRWGNVMKQKVTHVTSNTLIMTGSGSEPHPQRPDLDGSEPHPQKPDLERQFVSTDQQSYILHTISLDHQLYHKFNHHYKYINMLTKY